MYSLNFKYKIGQSSSVFVKLNINIIQLLFELINLVS